MQLELTDQDYNHIVDLVMNKIKQKSPSKANNIENNFISMSDFRKRFCLNKAPAWVRLYIFDRHPEILAINGGFVYDAHGRGKRTRIYLPEAQKWFTENRNKIDWSASLPR